MKILKKIDIYIIKKFLGTYFFAIALILAITVMFDINEKLDSFLKAPLSATISASRKSKAHAKKRPPLRETASVFYWMSIFSPTTAFASSTEVK